MFQVIEEEKLQENSLVVGTYFLKELAKLRDEFPIVGDVRGKGLMIGVEMVNDKVSIYEPFRIISIINISAILESLENALIIRCNNSYYTGFI